jgi:hypothetical protein
MFYTEKLGYGIKCSCLFLQNDNTKGLRDGTGLISSEESLV